MPDIIEGDDLGNHTASKQIDLSGFSIINTSYLESNATNPASAGVIRLGQNESIGWRNQSNTADALLSVNASDNLVFGGIFNALVLNQGIENPTYIQSFGGGSPANSGFIRLGNNESIRWRNSLDSADAGITFDASGEFTFDNYGLADIERIKENGTALPSTGFIRMANLSEIRWRNSVNTADSIIEGNGNSIILNPVDYVSVNGNAIKLIDFLESNATNPASAGTLRLGNNESIAFRNSGNTSNASIQYSSGDDLAFDLTEGTSVFNFNINSTQEYAFDNTQADFKQNTLTAVGRLEVGTGSLNAIRRSGSDTEFEVPSLAKFVFYHNSSVELIRIESNPIRIDMQNAYLWMRTNRIEWNDPNRTIGENGASMEYDTTTAGSHVFQVNGTDEYTFSATQADFKNNNLINFTFLQERSIAGGPSVSGVLRLNNTSKIGWRNSLDTKDVFFELDGNDELHAKFDDTTAILTLEADHTTPANGQEIGRMKFIDDSSTGVRREYASIRSLIEDPTNLTEDGELVISALKGGTLTDYIKINDANLIPIHLLNTVRVSGGQNSVELGNSSFKIQYVNDVNDFIRVSSNGTDTQVRISPEGSNYIFNATQADFTGKNLINVGYFESNTVTPADVGILRLGNTEQIAWRDNAGTGNLTLTADANDRLNIGSGFTDLNLNGAGILSATFIDVGSGVPAVAGAVRMPNNNDISWRNNANSADITLTVNASDNLELSDALNLQVGTTTGTEIGTATTQKLGFWGATPIVQPSGTGETVGFTAGAGTGVNDDSTFTGNVGTTAYRINDIVKALKNAGLLAS